MNPSRRGKARGGSAHEPRNMEDGQYYTYEVRGEKGVPRAPVIMCVEAYQALGIIHYSHTAGRMPVFSPRAAT